MMGEFIENIHPRKWVNAYMGLEFSYEVNFYINNFEEVISIWWIKIVFGIVL